MDVVLGVVGSAIALAAVVWFLVARTPSTGDGADRPGHEGEALERGTFGPAGPGAEAQAPPLSGRADRSPPPP